MICDRFDVVVVPFPFDEIPVNKRRPAVVLSGRTFNGMNGQTVFAMITTAKDTSWPSDVPIKGLEEGGLMTPCYIRLRFRTLPNASILRLLGRLSDADRQHLTLQLEAMIR